MELEEELELEVILLGELMVLEEQKRDQEWKDLPWHYPLALLFQELELELVLRLEPLALLFQELELELVLRLEPLALLFQELELELVLRLELLLFCFRSWSWSWFFVWSRLLFCFELELELVLRLEPLALLFQELELELVLPLLLLDNPQYPQYRPIRHHHRLEYYRRSLQQIEILRLLVLRLEPLALLFQELELELVLPLLLLDNPQYPQYRPIRHHHRLEYYRKSLQQIEILRLLVLRLEPLALLFQELELELVLPLLLLDNPQYPQYRPIRHHHRLEYYRKSLQQIEILRLLVLRLEPLALLFQELELDGSSSSVIGQSSVSSVSTNPSPSSSRVLSQISTAD